MYGKFCDIYAPMNEKATYDYKSNYELHYEIGKKFLQKHKILKDTRKSVFKKIIDKIKDL